MAKDSDPLAGALGAENTGGLFSSLVAEEKEFDRRTLWRLGCWGVIAVAAVTAAVMANQAQLGWRRDQAAAVDLARQAQQIQALTKDSQSEARRLASAIETLNGDRDRLYARVTVLEQGLESVTGTVSKQSPAPPATVTPPAAAKPQPSSSDLVPVGPPSPAPQAAAPAVPSVASAPMPPTEKPRLEATGPEKAMAALSPAPAASAPASSPPPVAAKSTLSPPGPAASKPAEPEGAAKPATAEEPSSPGAATAVAAKEPDAAETDLPNIPAQRTEFAVDLGNANSIAGLRALWRGLTKANPELAALRPIITVRESNTGFGMQLRLGAGPLADAAAAAKICAGLANRERGCNTIVFDGQRLTMKPEEAPQAVAKPAQQPHKYSSAKRTKNEEPPPPAKPDQPAAISSFFGRK